jgi:hypothetical protein
MGEACSNMPFTVVMEEGCQISKTLSYTAMFKHEVERKDSFLKLIFESSRFFKRDARVKEINCTVVTARTAAPSFFQNPGLDCESNPCLIF